MNITAKIIGATALGLGIAVAIPVLGQGYGMGMHGAYGGGFGSGHHMMGLTGMGHGQSYFNGNIEQHLEELKTALQLTTDQQTAWDQFEQSVKAMTASGHWNSGMGFMGGDPETHFTQMKAVFDAHKALYDTLTDQQKDTLNNHMPDSFGPHCGYNNS